MRTKVLIGLLLGAVLMVSGCAGQGDSSAASSGVPGSTAATLEFTGVTLDGARYDGRQLAGKPAVLWFWAPWCPTCRAQVGGVEKIAAEYAGRVNVVGVGGLSDAADIRAFAREVAGPTHLVDEEGAIWRHFGITAQSTYVLLDAAGAVVGEGFLDNEALATRVADLAG